MTVIEAPARGTTDVGSALFEGDEDLEAHIVYPKHLVTEAMVFGTAVEALCGYTWVPSRNPDRHGVCSKCVETFEEAMGRPWPGRK